MTHIESIKIKIHGKKALGGPYIYIYIYVWEIEREEKRRGRKEKKY